MDDSALLQIVKAQFLDIGVDMEIKTIDIGALRDFLAAGKNDQMSTGRTNPYSAPDQVVQNWATYGSVGNESHHNDTNYDAIVERFKNASDLAEAQSVLNEASMYFTQNHWAILMFPPFSYNVWQPYVKGYSGEYLDWNQDMYFARLWIDQELKEPLRY